MTRQLHPAREVDSLLWEVREDARRVMAHIASLDVPRTDTSAAEEAEEIVFFRGVALEIEREAFRKLIGLCMDNPAIDYGDACMLVHDIIKQSAVLQVREGYTFNERPGV